MNRTDRLLAIVLELQARGTRRADDLAASFEVSKRTIYRDVQALCEAGVPVVAQAGRGYSLVEGYFLPPLRFSADEAIMLLLGADVMAQSFDSEYRAAAEAAGRKIAGGLPEELRAEVQSLRASIRFLQETAGSDERLRLVRRAIVEQRTLRFDYIARHGHDDRAPTSRDADPYALLHGRGAWYFVGYCHLRRDLRHFRLDRMDRVVLLERHFARPHDFVPQPGDGNDDRQLVIRVLFDANVARWVREARSFYTEAEEQLPEGLLLTLRVRHPDEIVPWLLSWGSKAHVLEPESVRELLAEEARRMLVGSMNRY